MMAARLLLLAAFGVAGYLAWTALSGGTVAGCGPDSSCDKVLQSRWAYWLGLPVSAPAAVIYAGMLLAAFLTGHPSASTQRSAWIGLIGGSVVMIGAALWFVTLQVYFIGSFCPFCLIAHACAAIASTLLLSSVPTQAVSKKSGRQTGVILSARLRGRAAWSGAAGLALLIAGQSLVQPQRFLVKAIPGAATGDTAQAVRELAVHGGLFRLNLNELPLLGSADAPHVMVSLFDYTCHHCRDMHGLLREAQRRFSNQLAIVSLPMPLDANCNRLIQRTPQSHQNACEYARLGLAVWRAQPEAFPKFDDWLFGPSSPPPVSQARQYAAELVGQENLDRALADAWVERQVQTSVGIYDANHRAMGSRQMPQLMIGSSISTGPLDRIENLFGMIGEQFGLR